MMNIIKNNKLKIVGLGTFVFIVAFTLYSSVFADDTTALSATTISAKTTITSSLDIGSNGNDVTILQNFLAKDPSIYPEGLITGYYGSLTASAVSKFQAKNGIDTVGRVGPITRDKINAMILSGNTGGGSTNGTVGMAPSIFAISSTTVTNSDGTKSVTLSWQTDRPTRGKIFYSVNPLSFNENNNSTAEPTISGSAVIDGTFNTTKSLSISNLLASSTTYNYMIEAIDTNGNVSVTWPNTFSIQ